MRNFADYNPPDINEHKSNVDGYDFDKRLKNVDGRVWEIVDEDSGVVLLTLQFQQFKLNHLF